MSNTVRYWMWVTVGCCGLLLVACAKHETVPPEESPAPVSQPVLAQSLEPALPEAVSRAFQRSCQACHGPAGHGILAVAPDLRKAKARGPEQWKQFLSDPQRGHPGAQLPPPTWLSAAETVLLAEHLAGLTASNPPVAEPKAQTARAGKRRKSAR